MGLDMYLTARRRNTFSDPDILLPSLVPDGYPVESIGVRAAYWRKANAIHAWFVRNVQDNTDDCREYYVSHEQLREVRDLAQSVLDDLTKGEKLLPTQEGFFFGPVKYDDWYRHDMQETVDQLTRALKAFPEEDSHWSFYYQSSW